MSRPDLCGSRDASWLNCPDTHRVKRLHVIVFDDEGHAHAACGQPMLFASEHTPTRLAPPSRRCRRRGCRELWPVSEPRRCGSVTEPK